MALLDRMPGFQLAGLSGVRDVAVLLGLALSELAARRMITIDDQWQASAGPVALTPDPTPAFVGVLARLAPVDKVDGAPSVDRLAGQVIRDAGGRSRWQEDMVRAPLLAAGLLVVPNEPGPSSSLRAQVAAVLSAPERSSGLPTAAGEALVDAIAVRADALAAAVESGPDRDPDGMLRCADALGSALVCFPELWPPVQQAVSELGARPTGLFLTDLTDVMVTFEVGGALWT